MAKSLYFFRHRNDNIYWGTFDTQHGSPYIWLFRRRPMRANRWYVSGGNMFQTFWMAPTDWSTGGWLLRVSSDGGKSFTTFGIEREDCYRVNNGDVQLICNRSPQERLNFAAMFRNRMNEYRARYFMPLEKQMVLP